LPPHSWRAAVTRLRSNSSLAALSGLCTVGELPGRSRQIACVISLPREKATAYQRRSSSARSDNRGSSMLPAPRVILRFVRRFSSTSKCEDRIGCPPAAAGAAGS
jgi:hypothetical protein